MLADQTLAAFLDQSAAREPTPGGGSIAALIAALGAAMGQMAARFSEGRKDLADHAEALADEIARLDELRLRALELVDEDAAGFDAVGAAYGLPRGTDEEKAARKAAIQQALVTAMGPPLDACRLAVDGLEVLDSLRQHCNPNLISDVAVGAYALGAAFRAGWVNVLINVKPLKDVAVREGVLTQGAELAARASLLEQRIGAEIVDGLSP